MSEITVNLKVDASDLVAAIAALTTALAGTQTVEVETAKPEPEVTSEPEPTITLETVRARLAALSQNGKQAEVKALISKYGAKKLTEIPADKYPALMAEAEGL